MTGVGSLGGPRELSPRFATDRTSALSLASRSSRRTDRVAADSASNLSLAFLAANNLSLWSSAVDCVVGTPSLSLASTPSLSLASSTRQAGSVSATTLSGTTLIGGVAVRKFSLRFAAVNCAGSASTLPLAGCSARRAGGTSALRFTVGRLTGGIGGVSTTCLRVSIRAKKSSTRRTLSSTGCGGA